MHFAPRKIFPVFWSAALADATQGTLYTDMPGTFPVQSLEGKQAFFAAYDYDINTIFALLTTDFKDSTHIQAFEQVFNDLKDKGYAPKFNVTDNQETKQIKEIEKWGLQMVVCRSC